MRIKSFLLSICVAQMLHVQVASATDPNMAAAMGDLEQVKNLLMANPEFVEQRSGIGMTPLMSASSAGEIEVVRYLISLSAKVNAQDDRGLSPLHYAVLDGHEEVVKLLLEHGADISLRDKEGKMAKDLIDKIQFDFSRKEIQSLLMGGKGLMGGMSEPSMPVESPLSR